jgi:hypothetical protein
MYYNIRNDFFAKIDLLKRFHEKVPQIVEFDHPIAKAVPWKVT